MEVPIHLEMSLQVNHVNVGYCIGENLKHNFVSSKNTKVNSTNAIVKTLRVSKLHHSALSLFDGLGPFVV